VRLVSDLPIHILRYSMAQFIRYGSTMKCMASHCAIVYQGDTTSSVYENLERLWICIGVTCFVHLMRRTRPDVFPIVFLPWEEATQYSGPNRNLHPHTSTLDFPGIAEHREERALVIGK